MAIYDKNTFESQYNDATAGKPFQDNTTRAITEAVMRQFAKDISDSFVSQLNGVNFDVYSYESFDWLFSTAALSYGWISASAGAAAGIGSDLYGINVTEKVIGEIAAQTGTTATGRTAVYKSFSGIVFGTSMAFRLRMRCALETLGTGAQRYTAYIGYGDNVGAGDQTDGAYFRYADNVNGGKWQAVCRAAGVETAVDTGVAGTVNYSIFDIGVNAAGTVVTFQIDNNTPVTIATNIPTGANQTGIQIKIEKSIGTTSCSLHMDWFTHLITSASPR